MRNANEFEIAKSASKAAVGNLLSLVAQTHRHHVCAFADVHMHLHLQAPLFTGQAAQADNCHNHEFSPRMASFMLWHCLRLLYHFSSHLQNPPVNKFVMCSVYVTITTQK